MEEEDRSQNRDNRFVQARAALMHLDVSQSHFLRELAGKMPQTKWIPRPRAHTLCEPAQSKCTWTCYKSNFFCRTLQATCPRPGQPQNADTHFARACAIEMHLETNSVTSDEEKASQANASSNLSPHKPSMEDNFRQNQLPAA